MNRKPTLLKALPIQIIEANGDVFLKRGCTELRIHGERVVEVLETLLSLLANAPCTSEEICRHFAEPDRAAVGDLIGQLMKQRFIVESNSDTLSSDNVETPLDVFYWHFGQSAEKVARQLSACQFVILGVNSISRQMSSSLQESGHSNHIIIDDPLLRNIKFFDEEGVLAAREWPSSLRPPVELKQWLENSDPSAVQCLIATSDFGGYQRLRAWNKFCIENDRHFLPVALKSIVGYIGPLVISGDTACLECLCMREHSHGKRGDATDVLEQFAFEGQSVIAYHPSMTRMLGEIAALELLKFYGGTSPAWKIGELIEINLIIPTVHSRKILKAPRCLVCSSLKKPLSVTPYKNVFTLPEQASM